MKCGNLCLKYSFTFVTLLKRINTKLALYFLKAKSEDDKKAWQSAILTCMLSGYNKKLSDNIKTKVMENKYEQTPVSKPAEGGLKKKIASNLKSPPQNTSLFHI